MAVMFGQVVPGRYVLELAGEPAAVTAARQGSRFSMRESVRIAAGRAPAGDKSQIADAIKPFI